MKRIYGIFVLAAALFLSSQAFAMDLGQARSGGLVGEKLDGYVAVIGSHNEAQDLVNEVNSRRREEYAKISKSNGQSVAVVGKVAAEQIINGLPAGSYYQGADGGWNKK